MPGTVPYKDHIFSAHLVDVEIDGPPAHNTAAFVYLWSMRNNRRTESARCRPGDTIDLRLMPWLDVAARYERYNRSEPDDLELQLQEPCWGDELTPRDE
jgi:hypothetical protein